MGWLRLLVAVGFLLVPTGLLFAGDTGVSGTDLEFYRPSIDSFGFFSVNSPGLLKAGQASFKISESFAGGGPFQIAVDGQTVNLVDRVATTNFIGAVGINRFLNVGLDIPLHLYAREANFDTLESFTTTSLGDIRFALKLGFLEEKGKRPGFSLLVTNTFPTGNEMKFLGTSHMVPGADLILGKDFKYLNAALNFGVRFPEQKNVLGVNFDDRITYGTAVRVPFGFLDPLLSFVGEIRGHFEPNNIQIATAPIEFTAGLRKDFTNGFTLTGGGGGAWNNAIGNPRYRGVFSLSYLPRFHRKEKPAVSLATVYFGPGKIAPQAGSKEAIEKQALFLKDHKKKKVLLVGHTDAVGSHPFNLRLSLLRAKKVEKMLIDAGIDPARVEVRGVNADEPVAPNETAEGRSRNRRVEIFEKK